MFFRFLKTIMFVCMMSYLGTIDSLAFNQTLVVSLTNGKSVKIGLTDNPKTTFTDTDLVIETDVIKLSYPRETVASFKYENSQASIDDVVNDDDIIIVFNDDNIKITNLKQDAIVKLISIDGVVMASVKANIDGTANIVTSNFTPGIYIVNTGSINHKIFVR